MRTLLPATINHSLFPNSWFDEFVNEVLGESGHAHTPRFVPRLDVKETDDAIHVNVEIPGVDKDNIDISLESNILTIKGEKNHETEETKKGYHRVERNYGSFQRSLRLPSTIKGEKVAANLKDGVLEITIPKSEKSVNKITIN